MTNERATNKQLEERQEMAACLLAKGWPTNEIVSHLASTCDVTPQQARAYVRTGKTLVLELLDESDVKFEFYSCLNDLKRDRLDAREAGNFSAAVGATKARVKLLEQLPSIDPGGCWGSEIQSSFNEFIKERLAPIKGKIPRQRLSDMDDLDGKVDPLTGLTTDATGNFIYPDNNSIDNLPF